MGIVFDIVETINIGFEAVTGEAASSLRSQLSDATIRRSLRKRFMEIVDTEFAELPGGPAALRKVVSSRNFVKLVCGDNLTDQAVSEVENGFINATDSMDGAELSLLRNCLSKAALRVIEKSLPIGHRAILRGIQAISAKESGYLDPAERMLFGSAAAPARMPDPLPAALAGRLIAPQRPDAFCARPAVHDRVLGLLGQSGGGQAPIVAMAGMGGSGKTLLAQAVAHDPEIEARFPDGVLWLEVGDTPQLLCQAAILGAVGAVPAGDSVEAGRTALRQRLLGARCLLILDDVVCAGQVTALDVVGPGSALLVTTRDLGTLPHGTLTCLVGAFDLADPVEHADAMSLLAQYASGTPDIASADAAHAEEVVTRCGGLPLALAICGAMVSDGYPWETVVDLLRKADLASLEKAFRGYPRPSLLSAIAIGAISLDAPILALYEELAVFSTRGGVPVKAAARLWSHHGLDAGDSLRTVIFLGRRSLLTYRPADSTFLLHDLQYDYTRWRVGAGLPDLHCRLADSYLTSWGGLSAGLPALDPADARIDDCRYGITYVADHLAKADRDDLLHALLAAEVPASAGGTGNSWFDVHDQLGWTAEYLADIDLARVRAEKSTDQSATPADRTRHIATEIRYALVRSSLASIAGTISPRLLAVLVRRGMWSFEKARAYAIVIPDAEDRAATLTLLAQLPESGTSDRVHLLDLARQAAGTITYSMQRAMAYGRIAVASSEPDRSLLFDQALEAADASSQAGRVRAWLLTWLASYYPARAVAELRRGAAAGPSAVEYRHAMTATLEMLPDLRDDVLHTARHGHYRGERGAAFRAVLRCTPPEQRPAIIEEMLIAIASSDKQWRKEELAAEAAAYLPAEHLPAFLAETLDGASPHATIRALAGALPRFPADQRADAQAAAVSAVRAAGPGANRQDLLALLPCILEPDRTNLIEEIVDAAQHAHPARAEWMLCDLAPILPEHLLRRAVDTSDEVSPPSRAVGLLAPHLTPELLRRALAAHSLDSAEEWAGAFVHLAPHLPRTSPRQIVELVAAVKDESRRLALLTRLTPCLPPDLVGLAAETAESASDIETRAQILAELASRAQEPQRSALYRQAVDAAESENYPHTRFRALTQMTAKPEQLADVLRMQCTLDERRGRHTRADLRSMALPDPVINLAVEIVHGIEEPCSRARALAILVPHVTESRRPGPGLRRVPDLRGFVRHVRLWGGIA